MTFQAFFLPGPQQVQRYHTLTFSDRSLIVPDLSATELQETIDRLLAARQRLLLHRPVQSLLASLDQVVQLWLDSSSLERQEAEAILPATTGLSAEMLAHVLPLIFQEYRAELLETLLRDELADLQVLDSFIPTPAGQRRAWGPALITQILAGNVPGAGLDGILFALLVKSATLVKASSAEPLLPALFARTVARVDPDLGTCLAVVPWTGGNATLEDLACTRADVVLASGSDTTLTALRRRAHGRFIGYGHKLSLSVIGRDAIADALRLAQQAAYDVVLFDQRGCLSPQVIYVEKGGATTPEEFAALLAQALDEWQNVLPRGRVTAEDNVAIQRVRDEAEWQALAGKPVIVHASAAGTDWTVIYESDTTFTPSPLYRTVRVKPLASLSQLTTLLAPWRAHLEAAGLAISAARQNEAAELLGQVGVNRICPIGTMQTPPLAWRHGGRPRLADLVRWVGLE